MNKIAIIAAAIVCILIVGLQGFEFEESDLPSDRLRVGVLLNTRHNDRNWCQTHFEGMEKTAAELQLSVLYREGVPDESESCDAVIDKLVEEGCAIIIATSYGFHQSVARSAEKHPDVCFFQLSGPEQKENLAVYFGRIYQIRYLTGVIAGLQSESGHVGYVAAFPISEVVRGINAFALGVRSVNPRAQISLTFINSWYDDELTEKATDFLLRQDPRIDVLTCHTNSLRMLEMAEQRGIWSIGYNLDNSALFPKTYLTASQWRWDRFYVPRIREYIRGKFEGKSYWEGAETGIVALAPLTANVKDGIEARLNESLDKLRSRTFDVFYGPIRDNAGALRIAEGESMSDDHLLAHFDWYVEGVRLYGQE